jgi:hypothetical protein
MMPLEINEIGIRLQVSDPRGDAETGRPPEDAAGPSRLDRDEIVAECMRRVLRLLAEARER